jgi:hypothetical protein
MVVNYNHTAGSCEYANALSGFMKDGKVLDVLSDYQLFKKNSA